MTTARDQPETTNDDTLFHPAYGIGRAEREPEHQYPTAPRRTRSISEFNPQIIKEDQQ